MATTSGWVSNKGDLLAELKSHVEVKTQLSDYKFASAVEQNALVYDCKKLAPVITSRDGRREVMAELCRALLTGPGIFAFKNMYSDTSIVDRVSETFWQIIDEQHARGEAKGDHYAKPGSNDRVWNVQEKLALRDPDAFVDYYRNDFLTLVATAWLGPGYQVTTQVNVVNPGGDAQQPHRDYHLGFMTDEQAIEFPVHVHGVSPLITLQGAVAHTDMPRETGPTMYLPHSQKMVSGYVAWRNESVKKYFSESYSQLPLKKGDGAFFNPALLHAAGTNQTKDIKRMANLTQIGSAFGRTLESVDREQMSNAIYPALRARKAAGWSEHELKTVIAASAEGYAFPTNLDRDPPLKGLAPQSQADFVWQALASDQTPEQLRKTLAALAERQKTDRA
ncbi:MAG: phytanoyl-CoA dioxygenase family protein [Actinomycetota bacterium]|nr:phytanoyl-CoA dioxygenase family protein [Actinomycetota bacterium]